jgi:NADH:ubiquinone oxidoreductase subunit 4 (subunit M)
VQSRESDALNLAAIAPLVAVVVALGLYPNFVVERTERSTTAAIEGARSMALTGFAHPERSVIE